LKVLILRFSSIGDIILTTPVVRCIKTQLPNCELHYATKKTFKAIVATNPYIDKVHVLDQSLSVLIQALKTEEFDLIIDLHHNLRTAIIKFRLGVAAHSFNKLNIDKWLMVRFKWNRLPAQHIVDRYMETLQSLGVENDKKGLDYFIPSVDVVHETLLPTRYIAFVIGAKFATKRLPNHKIIAICQTIAMPIVLLGGKEDMDNATEIAAACGAHVINTCGQYNLNQSASIVQQAALVITHDTGLMHIAAAFQKKIISVWGNTIPDFGMYPYLPNETAPAIIIENKNLSCRPCSKIGYSRCPKGHFNCMEQISNASITEAVHSLL